MKNQNKQNERIFANRHNSQKWSELYLKTFHAEKVESGTLTDAVPELTVYQGKRIASIVLRKNAERSGAKFENELYLSCNGYDLYNGRQVFADVGGADFAGLAIMTLQDCINQGCKSLDDIIDGEKSVFRYVCSKVNSAVHKRRTDAKTLTSIEEAQIDNYNSFIENTEEMTQSEIMTFIDVMEHIKLTPIQMRYLDYIANGASKREIARAEGKDPSTVRESFKSIKAKFAKYCDENGIDFARIDILTKHTEE